LTSASRDPEVVGFDIVYADETRFTDRDGSWDDAPAGAQIVIWRHEDGRTTWSWGVDDYYLPGHERRIEGVAMDTEAEFNALLERTRRAEGLS
jgi:hypothetical protein